MQWAAKSEQPNCMLSHSDYEVPIASSKEVHYQIIFSYHSAVMSLANDFKMNKPLNCNKGLGEVNESSVGNLS